MSSVKELVDQGLMLRERIKRDTDTLKDIQERLEAIGLTREQEMLKDEERDGRRWLARGTGKIVPVVFTADKLKGSFQDGGPFHVRVNAAAEGQINEFFRVTRTWKNLFDDGKAFRKHARDVLGEIKGPAFVTACLDRDKDGIPKSDVKILWDDVENA